MKEKYRILDRQMSITNRIISTCKRIDRRYYIVFLSVFLIGLVTHGMALFNKYAVHDEISFQFDVGYTYQSGRWALGIISDLVYLAFKTHYSLPIINGLLSIFFIAVSVCLIIKLFEIRNIIICILLSGVFVTIPVVAVTFAFMFTAPYYMFALFLTVFGVYILFYKEKWYCSVIGILFITFAIGIYQAYISVALSLILFLFIKEVKEKKHNNMRSFLFRGLFYFVVCVSFVLLYLLITKITTLLLNVQLTGHQGISNMGSEGLSVYFQRTLFAYHDFFLHQRDIATVYISSLKYVISAVILLQALLTIIMVIKLFKVQRVYGIQAVVLVVLIPMTVNFIEIMANPDIMYEIMLYGQTMLFVYFAWLLENTSIEKTIVQKSAVTLSSVVLLFFSVVWCRYDNILYLKSEIQQQRAISYYTTLVTSIKTADGYDDDLPVVFIGNYNEDKSVSNIDELSWTNMHPYNGIEVLINDYAWKGFMKMWTGYNPTYADPESFEGLPRVLDMPSYPDDGSIQRINDTMVIKLNDLD